MIDTEVSVMDREQVKRFLNMFATGISDNEKAVDYFRKAVGEAETMPFESFKGGLGKVTHELETLMTNPLARIALNPAALFASGLLIGYALTLASGDPELHKLLSDLEDTTKNVRPISSAKKAQQ